MTLIIKNDLSAVNWQELKEVLVADDFDNGRSPRQLEASFANSYVTSIAYLYGGIVGTARALSDGICNAYIVDVWTLSKFRNQGIARRMMDNLIDRLTGQHVYLFTDENAVGFYKKLGFQEQGIGLSLVKGEWLQNESAEFTPTS